MAKLILLRHGATDDNVKGIWSGWRDSPLAPAGVDEARRAAALIQDLSFSAVFVSDLVRSKQTWAELAAALTAAGRGKVTHLKPIVAPELKERDYGDLAGQNKWAVKEKYGEEQWQRWRRGWDEPVPNGENLHAVYDRVAPYYEREILPRLRAGENVLVVAHGNSLRALVKRLEELSVPAVEELEIATGAIWVYDIDERGKVTSKEIRGETVNEY